MMLLWRRQFGGASEASAPVNSPFIKIGFAYVTEKTGGIWDFKNQPYAGAHPELEDFGNFHYGAIGRATGLPDTFMQWAAGVASWRLYRAKGKPDPYGNPLSGAAGQVEIKLANDLCVEVVPDDSLNHEHWRLLRPYQKDPHIVVTGSGIEEE
jgi:hypothetical protein